MASGDPWTVMRLFLTLLLTTAATTIIAAVAASEEAWPPLSSDAYWSPADGDRPSRHVMPITLEYRSVVPTGWRVCHASSRHLPVGRNRLEAEDLRRVSGFKPRRELGARGESGADLFAGAAAVLHHRFDRGDWSIRMKQSNSRRLNGDPGSLDVRGKFQPSKELRETSHENRSPGLEKIYGLRSKIPGHHPRLGRQGSRLHRKCLSFDP